MKKAAYSGPFDITCKYAGSALTSLETRVLLVDDVNTTPATNHTVGAVTALEGLERISDLHFLFPIKLACPQFSGRLQGLRAFFCGLFQ